VGVGRPRRGAGGPAAGPPHGAEQISKILLEQLELAPPQRKRRLSLPRVADLRRIGARRLRLTAVRVRRRQAASIARPRFRSLRRLPRWRGSRRS
jgi:hypothetical protein